MKKRILLGGLLALTMLGCGEKEETSVPKEDAVKKVVFWHGYTAERREPLTKFIEEYETLNPGIDIVDEYIAQGDKLLQKVQVALQTNSTPDILWGYPTWTGVLASSGRLFPVEDLMTQEDRDDFFKGALDANVWSEDGKSYSVPVEGGALILIYNKDLVAEAPENWDTLRESTRELTKNGKEGIYLPFGVNERTAWTWESFLWQSGGDLVANGSEVTFGGNEGREAFEFYTDLIISGDAPSDSAYDVDTNFIAGNIGYVIGTQGAAKYYTNNGVDVGVAELPANVQRGTGLGSNTLYLFKSNEETEKAAWEFMSWLTNAENNAKYTTELGYVPIRKSAVETDSFKEFGKQYPGHLVAGKSLVSGYARPNSAWYPEMSVAISEAIEAVVYGNKDAETALKDAVEQSREAIANVQ